MVQVHNIFVQGGQVHYLALPNGRLCSQVIIKLIDIKTGTIFKK